MKAKFTKIPSTLRALVFSVAFAVMSACSTDTEVEVADEPGKTTDEVLPQTDANSTASDASRLSMRGQGFFRELLSLNKGLAGDGVFHGKIPAVWVFSPQGKLTRMVLDDDTLENFSRELSTVDVQVQDITCQQVDTAVVRTTGEEWSMSCAEGKWTALLLLSSTECADSCPRYEKVVAQAEKEHADVLQTRTLVLSFGE